MMTISLFTKTCHFQSFSKFKDSVSKSWKPINQSIKSQSKLTNKFTHNNIYNNEFAIANGFYKYFGEIMNILPSNTSDESNILGIINDIDNFHSIDNSSFNCITCYNQYLIMLF